MKAHTPIRNIVGAMEKQLAKDLEDAGYTVLNRVGWKHAVAEEDWRPIRAAFAKEFPRLASTSK